MKQDFILKLLLTVLAVSLVMGTAVAQNQDQDTNNQTEAPGEAFENVRAPGDRFYGFKTFRERIELSMARAPLIGSEEEEAKVLSKHAEERLVEATKLMERNNTERAQQTIERYSNTINRASEAANRSGNNQTRRNLAEATERHREMLRGISERAPEEAQQGIMTALENTQRARRNMGDVGEMPGQNSNLSEGLREGPGIVRDENDSGETAGNQQGGSGGERNRDTDTDLSPEEDLGSPGL